MKAAYILIVTMLVLFGSNMALAQAISSQSTSTPIKRGFKVPDSFHQEHIYKSGKTGSVSENAITYGLFATWNGQSESQVRFLTSSLGLRAELGKIENASFAEVDPTYRYAIGVASKLLTIGYTVVSLGYGFEWLRATSELTSQSKATGNYASLGIDLGRLEVGKTGALSLYFEGLKRSSQIKVDKISGDDNMSSKSMQMIGAKFIH